VIDLATIKSLSVLEDKSIRVIRGTSKQEEFEFIFFSDFEEGLQTAYLLLEAHYKSRLPRPLREIGATTNNKSTYASENIRNSTSSSIAMQTL